MRQIEPLDLADVVAADLQGQRQPDFDLVDPCDLHVDDDYQRGIGPKSLALIQRIYGGFRWSKFKPPICVRVGGRLHVVDGQHTAIACASHPGITVIPIIVVDEPEMVNRAKAFVSHARDRLSATPGQIHRAEVAAGDDEALVIDRVCRVAGLKLLPFPPHGAAYKVAETIALQSIRALVKRRGEEQAALTLAAVSELAPVTAESIKAADALLSEPEYAAEFDVDRVAAAFRALGPRAMTEAKALAAAKNLPVWRALVAILFKHRKGGKLSVQTAPKSAEPIDRQRDEKPAPVARVSSQLAQKVAGIARPPGPPRYNAGDPAPGRSALDQRRASA